MCSSLVTAAAAAAEGTSRDLQTKNRSCRFCSIWGRIYRLRLSTYNYYYPLTISVLKREQYLSNICSLFLVLLISLKCRVVKKRKFFWEKNLLGNESVIKWRLWWILFLPDWSCLCLWIGLWYSNPLPPPPPFSPSAVLSLCSRQIYQFLYWAVPEPFMFQAFYRAIHNTATTSTATYCATMGQQAAAIQLLQHALWRKT